ncbi:mitochondrial 54S ribosomal protein YmL19 [Mycena amicta]|nr:mitochondrial 54S ribosomal protein YmL19 [Mycena amicta]
MLGVWNLWVSHSQQRLLVPAGKAAPTPPVGPALGARGVKSMDFCKEFNARTAHIEQGVPVPTLITIQPDRSFTFITKTPPTSYFLKQVAGIDKGAGKPGHETTIESIARMVVGSARSLGVQVVP